MDILTTTVPVQQQELKVSCNSNGDMKLSLIIPTSQSKRDLLRKRSDSGFEEEDHLLSNGILSEEEPEKMVIAKEGNQQKEMNLTETVQTPRIDGVKTEPIMESCTKKIQIFDDKKGCNGEQSSETKIYYLSTKHTLLISTFITIIALLILIVWLIDPLKVSPTEKYALNLASSETSLRYSEVSGFIPCSKDCTDIYSEITRDEQILVLAGGKEDHGEIVSDIHIFPHSRSLSHCIPPLPLLLRWGALGLLNSTLLLCGGEGPDGYPTSSCWSLDNRSADTAKWRFHSNMSSARSQSANTVSSDGSIFQIISGYNPEEEERGLSSLQLVTIKGPKKEVSYPSISRLAAAATFTTGAVIVTGGLGSENQVWLNPSPNVTWGRRKDMIEGRKGHAVGIVKVGGVEVVVVAGGWGLMGQELISVEMYRHDQDMWTSLPSMPKPRVDFAIKVSGSILTAVGGHSTESGGQVSQSPWSLYIAAREGRQWVVHGEQEGTSGALATSVPRDWIEQLCRVKGFK